MSQNIKMFDTSPQGQPVRLFCLDSRNGCIVKLCEYGATITSIRTQDHEGKLGEVCLGYDNLENYIKDKSSIGATIGRYANRLKNSQFMISGTNFHLDANAPPHHLHGGKDGFAKQLWSGEMPDENKAKVIFKRTSPDGECGYPGNLDTTVTYELSTDNCLSISYEAICDQETYVNLTNHAYFNLSAAPDVTANEITIFSSKITLLDEDFITLGTISDTADTPFDLQEPTLIGNRLSTPNAQMTMTCGFDINYVIGANDGSLKKAAFVYDPVSHRNLLVSSTQPCLQFYTTNKAGILARDGSTLPKHAALCLEAQDYPNGPNTNAFPTSPLLKGDTYKQTIKYHFGLGRL